MKELEPKSVFKYFGEISEIPRCSNKEKEISDYLVSFAKENGLEVFQDEILNVIIKKKGTLGYENAPTVILQGHMDMVCEKNEDVEHDFEKDPLNIKIEGDMITADGTTLGADNGIAVAFCLALLSSDDIPHPPLEVLITTQEETGLRGAAKVDPSKLEGKILINIDAEEEGVLFTSCAGGIRSVIELPIIWEDIREGYVPYNVSIKGLKGGHSGMDIDKKRGNANKLMGRVLRDLVSENNIYINSVNGGMKINAIPREANAKISIKFEDIRKIENQINKWDKIFKNEFKSSDIGITVNIKPIDDTFDKVLSKETVNKLISLYTLIPYGVQTMSGDIEGLVESSTNLGIVTTDEEKISFGNSNRSSVRSLKDNIVEQMKNIAEILELEMTTEASYPEWEYKKDSYIRDLFVKVHEDLYGKSPVIAAIHAGLECGLFSEILGDVDMIALGPNMHDVHTPDERLSISSTKNTWEYLCAVLKKIK